MEIKVEWSIISFWECVYYTKHKNYNVFHYPLYTNLVQLSPKPESLFLKYITETLILLSLKLGSGLDLNHQNCIFTIGYLLLHIPSVTLGDGPGGRGGTGTSSTCSCTMLSVLEVLCSAPLKWTSDSIKNLTAYKEAVNFLRFTFTFLLTDLQKLAFMFTPRKYFIWKYTSDFE